MRIRFSLPAYMWVITLAAIFLLATSSRSSYSREKKAGDSRIESQIMRKVARARADLRSLAVAIESYRMDMTTYPAYTEDIATSFNASAAKDLTPDTGKATHFRKKSSASDRLITLTTPISYLPLLFTDPFAPQSEMTYAYFSPMEDSDDSSRPQGWISWSAGPDGDYDLDWELYDPTNTEANLKALAPVTYDPTNGWASGGDIWITK